jgi:hypothetical protein
VVVTIPSGVLDQVVCQRTLVISRSSFLVYRLRPDTRSKLIERGEARDRSREPRSAWAWSIWHGTRASPVCADSAHSAGEPVRGEINVGCGSSEGSLGVA